jgi:hypothetical protein
MHGVRRFCPFLYGIHLARFLREAFGRLAVFTVHFMGVLGSYQLRQIAITTQKQTD